MSKKKKMSFIDVFSVVFPFLGGAFTGFFWIKYIDTEKMFENRIASFVFLFLILYIAMIMHTLIHEAGHLIFGLLSGYKFCSFRIYSFLWIKQDGKIKLKRDSVLGTAGQCLLSSPEKYTDDMPYVLYNLGGVLFNLIFSVFSAVLTVIFSQNIYLSISLNTFTILGFIFAFINGIPMKMNTINNDGYNLVAISRSPDALKSFWLQLKVSEQLAHGVRLKDMPREWFVLPSDEQMKNSMTSVIGVYHCNYLMDKNLFEQADKTMAHIMDIESGIVGLHHNLMICDRIFCQLILGEKSEAIEPMLTKEQKKFMNSMKQNLSVLRTQYAYALLAENNLKKADAIKSDFEKRSKTYPYMGDLQGEQELLEIAQNKYNSIANSLNSVNGVI